MITVLSGGVGGAKLVQGLAQILPPDELTVIVNTGDDIELHGLYISPDVDIMIYTLASIVDPDKGWGIRGDTFNCLEMLDKLGFETWFKLGDRDLSTHIIRTQMLRQGKTPSEVTRMLCERFNVNIRIIPMTDERFQTKIMTENGTMHFEEYLVKRGARDRVLDVIYEGRGAPAAAGAIESLKGSDGIIIPPSNPIVSIGTILSLEGVRNALLEAAAPVVAMSPIIGGAPVKGPADKLMEGLGMEVSAFGVAKFYGKLIDAFVIDNADRPSAKMIENLGIRVVVTDTLMRTMDDKVRLAEYAVNLIRGM